MSLHTLRAEITSLWPLKVATFFWVLRSQILTKLSSVPVARINPSGCNIIQVKGDSSGSVTLTVRRALDEVYLQKSLSCFDIVESPSAILTGTGNIGGGCVKREANYFIIMNGQVVLRLVLISICVLEVIRQGWLPRPQTLTVLSCEAVM